MRTMVCRAFLEITNFELNDRPNNKLFFVSGKYKYGIQNDVENRIYNEKFDYAIVSYADLEK